MSALAEAAAGSDVILAHENEKDIYGDIPRRCLDIVTSVSSPKLQLAWDPAASSRSAPFTEGYAMPPVSAASRSRTRCWRMARSWSLVLATARCRDGPPPAAGFDGFFAAGPHLGGTAFGALSGPDCSPESWAFTDILTSEGCVRMSTVSESDRCPIALVGAGVIGTIHGAVISEQPTRSTWSPSSTAPAGREAGRPAWRDGVYLADGCTAGR